MSKEMFQMVGYCDQGPNPGSVPQSNVRLATTGRFMCWQYMPPPAPGFPLGSDCFLFPLGHVSQHILYHSPWGICLWKCYVTARIKTRKDTGRRNPLNIFLFGTPIHFIEIKVIVSSGLMAVNEGFKHPAPPGDLVDIHCICLAWHRVKCS